MFSDYENNGLLKKGEKYRLFFNQTCYFFQEHNSLFPQACSFSPLRQCKYNSLKSIFYC